MKQNIIALMMLTLLAGTLAACAPAAAGTVQIGAAEAGQKITMKAGDTLVITLDGNLTTGYNWVPVPQDPVLLEQIGEPIVTPASDALGASGVIVLKFTAVAQGQTTMSLEYRQPWDTETPPEQSYKVTVVVE